VREQFEPRTSETFDLMTQELYRLLPTMIDTQSRKQNRRKTEPQALTGGTVSHEQRRPKSVAGRLSPELSCAVP
jgi:hypothetical protein